MVSVGAKVKSFGVVDGDAGIGEVFEVLVSSISKSRDMKTFRVDGL